MQHIRNIIQIVFALRKSQSALYSCDKRLTALKAYDEEFELREVIWDAIKTTEELLDKIDRKE